MRPKKIRYSIRKKRVRKRIYGTSERPRLSVYRSLKHIYAQIIDDNLGKTLVSASSLSKELKGLRQTQTLSESKGKLNSGSPRSLGEAGGKIGVAKLVGELVAKKALGKGIKKAVFDRGGRLYHGRVRALAERVREGGLEF